MIRRTYQDTAAHILLRNLSALLSGRSLNREALREAKSLFCKQGVTGSIPVTSTNFFLIAKELEKTPRPERSIIRAHCARMRHWSNSVHNSAAEKASASPTGVISFARRLSFSRASRFIRNFI
jgi:hypothetical protein